MAEPSSSKSPPSDKPIEMNSGTVHDSHSDDTPTLFKLDPGVGIWALVVFVFLLMILKKYAWGPIIGSIDDREKNIRDSMDKAKQAQNESKRMANEQNQIIQTAKSDASAIVQRAKGTAEELANKIKQEALEEKARIVESGVKSVDSARASAMASLKKDTADLAIKVAENLLNETLDDEKHQKYVEKAIDELSISE